MGRVGIRTGEGRETVVYFGVYTIRNGRNGVLELSLREMDQANLDLGVFQDTKVANSIYTYPFAGYHVFASNALSRHCRGCRLL